MYRDKIGFLIRVRNRIARPESWLQDQSAVNKDNAVVSPLSPEAVKWCLVGAIYAEGTSAKTGADIFDNFSNIWEILRPDNGSIAHFNDTHEHHEIIELLNKKIRGE